MRGPVCRRKGDAPEIGSRRKKFDSDFGFPFTDRTNTDYATGLFFPCFRILQNDNLADTQGEFKNNQSAMSIDDRGITMLPGHFFVRTRTDDGDGHAEQNTLTATPIVLGGEMRGERGHGRFVRTSVASSTWGVKRRKVLCVGEKVVPEEGVEPTRGVIPGRF